MESLGTMPEGAWNSYNGMCYEEADFMAHLVGNCSLSNDTLSSSHYQASSYWPNQESNVNVVGFYDSSIYSSDEIDINTHSFPQGSSHGGYSEIRSECYHSNTSEQFFVANNSVATMDYCNNVMEGGHFLNHGARIDRIDSNENLTELQMPERMEEDKVPSPSSKKRLRIPRDVQRSKRSMKLKESVMVNEDDNDENNSDYKKVVPHRENSISCSEDDNELNGVVSGSTRALNSNGKTRANRGSATDPQSLYARKRRERINERLRILQSIVPNGTKVDISTMLEEAVEYVKFLQLQIKLLSSDEHWMYAPIAYNGMDIGLDLRIRTPNPQS